MTCNHTKDLYVEQNGRLVRQGSWIEAADKTGLKIVCGNCGRFYGRISTAKDEKDVKPRD